MVLWTSLIVVDANLKELHSQNLLDQFKHPRTTLQSAVVQRSDKSKTRLICSVPRTGRSVAPLRDLITDLPPIPILDRPLNVSTPAICSNYPPTRWRYDAASANPWTTKPRKKTMVCDCRLRNGQPYLEVKGPKSVCELLIL